MQRRCSADLRRLQRHNVSLPMPHVYCAGNIGRGFIAPLLSQAGYKVVFVDVDKAVIDGVNVAQSYRVHVLDTGEVEVVGPVTGVLATDTEALIRELTHPSLRLVTTAVGLAALDRIAPALARGIHARREAGRSTFNIIACENAIAATAQLAEKVRARLDAPDTAYAAQHVGFANCSADRIVPPFDPTARGASPLDVGVAAFFEWVVEAPALKGTDAGALDVPVHGMHLVADLGPYNERKLFTLNAGHAIAAYLGHRAGLRTVAAALADARIEPIVRSALLDEVGPALCRKHGFDEVMHGEYVAATLARFADTAVKDDVVRVARAPLRKLGRGDRLLGPVRMCVEYGIAVPHLAMGTAAALWYDNPDDEQSVQMRGAIAENGVDVYMAALTGLDEGGEAYRLILRAYAELQGWRTEE
ncbi:mannitol dehydrogenase domain-containing protein [Mycena belliarum]|uniref:Mannitol dehydrogenase domain-containing protein n=1 Tax=Mycena belliarum TaxID=1033014 RepID=A0AAD6XW22_9AGAR|nr:mannitol dehydrogenase domain-containing protein [Mycena belliae]